MNDVHSLRPEDLSLHSAWIRALARRLVRDDAAADDLVQETWLAALQRAPSTERSLRPWLGRVVRNLAAKRLARECVRASAALPSDALDVTSTPEQTVETLEQQRLLVELVEELPEPERTTLVLRYTHGLTSPEIARRQRVPEGTVRWRLKRAIDLLRAELDERNGGARSAWSLALLPLFERQEAELAASAGAGVASAITTVPTWIGGALAATLAVALLVVLIGQRDASRDRVAPAVATEEPWSGADGGAVETRVPSPIASKSGERSRTQVAESTRPADASGAIGAGQPVVTQLSGTVRDTVGRPVGPGWLRLDRIDGNGDFEMPFDTVGSWSITNVTPGRYYLGAEQLPEGYVAAWNQYQPRGSKRRTGVPPSQLGPVFTPDYGSTEVVVEAGVSRDGIALTIYRAGAVRGIVRAFDGSRVASCVVRLRGLEAGFEAMTIDAEPDEHAEFHIEGVWPGSYELLASQGFGESGLAQSSFPVVSVMADQTAWVDVWLGEGTAAVHGTIVDEEGRPFAALKVLFFRGSGRRAAQVGWATTDAGGRFDLAGLQPGSYSAFVGPFAFHVGAEPGKNRIARRVAPVDFEIDRPGQSVELDPIEAIRSKPFVMNGALQLSPSHEVGMSDVRILVRSSRGPHSTASSSEPDVKDHVGIATDGSFEWWCETPHEDVELVVSDRRGRHPERVISIVPERGVERALTIAYP